MKKISRLFGMAAVAAALLVGGTAGIAQAVPLLVDEVSKIKFTNYENWVDTSGNGVIDAGDKIVGIMKATTISNVSTSNIVWASGPAAAEELTAHFQITVTGGLMPTLGGLGHLDFGMAPGDFFRFYVDPAKNWDPSTVAGGVLTSTDGALWAAIEATTTFYEGVTDVTIAFTQAVNRNWGNLTVNNTGYIIQPQLYPEIIPLPGWAPHWIDMNGNGVFDAGDISHGAGHVVDTYIMSHVTVPSDITVWGAKSEDPIYIYATVPEPSTVLLLGAGLVGLGLWGRKRMVK